MSALNLPLGDQDQDQDQDHDQIVTMANSSKPVLPPYDQAIQDIADYVTNYESPNVEAWKSAQTAVLDALGCAVETVAKSAECRNIIGPYVPGSNTPDGFKLPGTPYRLDPVKGAFDLGTMIRYLDHNDALAGKDWGHPSDNLGALLPVMDYLGRAEKSGKFVRSGGPPLTIHTFLSAVIKVYEIQGLMLLKNAFNAFGLDHTILVKLASASVVPWLFGLSTDQIRACISHVWMDTAPLRVYRAGHNTVPRKGWAAGDACARAVQFSLLVARGQPGSPTALTMPRWGFYATTWRGTGEFVLPMKYSDWVIQNIFYKVMPVEGHGIAPCEAAAEQVKRMRKQSLTNPVADIARIVIRTNAAAKMIIDKPGKLYNHADRDHCMQYAVAVTLLKGDIPESADFDDTSPFASSADVEALRSKITINADDDLTADYLNIEKKSIPSGLTVHLVNGDVIDEVLVEFPRGHMKRPETPQHVNSKFEKSIRLLYSESEAAAIRGAIEGEGSRDICELLDMLARDSLPGSGVKL